MCVVVQGKAVFTAHVKNILHDDFLMRNMQFVCVFQAKSGIHRSCSGKWNGLLVMILTGLKLICML